jgi:hypothetical protein
MTPRAQPTPEQLTALRAFARFYGRTWKSRLRQCWMTVDYRELPSSIDYGHLQRLRNTLGPSWLVRFRLIP